MGLLNIFRPSRSIVSRLTWRITVATIISLILILGLIFVLIYILGVAATGLIFGTAMEVTNEKMNTVEDWEDAVTKANQSTDRTLWIKAITPSGRKVSFVVDLNE